MIKIRDIQVKYINLLTLIFFILISIFPTIRNIILGSATSSNIVEYLISSIPDILCFSLVGYVIYIYIKNKTIPIINKIDWVVLVFIFTNVIYGSIISKNIILTIYGIRITYIPVLFYFVGRYGFSYNNNITEAFYKHLFYWFIILSVLGIVLYFIFPDFMIRMILMGGGTLNYYAILRMTSIFWSPLLFGYILSFAGVYTYYKICHTDKIFYYIMISIFWFCLFYTVTRAAIGTFLIGIVLLTLLLQNWKSFSKVLILLLLILLSFNISFTKSKDNITSKRKEVSSWLLSSTVKTLELEEGISRVDLWKKSYNSFIIKPQGYGLGKAGWTAKRFFKNEKNKEASIYSTDCWYLKIANETGILGIISYITIFVLLFVKYSKILFINKNSIFMFLFTMFVIALIANIFHNYIDIWIISYLFWLGTGISITYAENLNKTIIHNNDRV